MSEAPDKRNDEVLARNVGELLRHSHEPPAMASAARSRILAELKDKLPASEVTEKAEEAKPRLLTRLLRPLRARPIRAGALALACAGLAVVGGFALESAFDQSAGEEFIAQELSNEDVAPKQISLVDGTVVTLRAGAAIAAIGPRSVLLQRGDAIFDVAVGKTPFVVSRPNSDHRVVVLGTRFVLSAADQLLTAAVIRGSVKLEAGGEKLTLAAGQGGEVRGNQAPTRMPIPRLSHLVSWSRSARIRAEGQDMGAIRKGNLVARFPGNDTAADYPLPIRDFSLDVYLENQIARVAIDQTFFNEHPAQLEGVYSFSLPSGAAISRLAMYVGENLMEAGIAERSHARSVYESIVYRRRDPALMEWMAGNEVRVRVFPLFGRQEKRILLSYTQSLERLYDDVQLSVPLPRLERPVGTLRLRARLADCAQCEVFSTSHAIETKPEGDDLMVTFENNDHTIVDDLLLTIRNPVKGPRVVATKVGDEAGAQHLVMMRTTPDLGSIAVDARKPRRWVILHDTSGSRSPLERKAQGHVIDRLLEELDERDELAVVAFDATVRKMSAGSFVSVSQANAKAVHDFASEESRGGLGFTDLEKGLKAAIALLAEAPRAGDYEPMILYLGDGVVTGGDRQPADLVKIVRGRATVVAVAIGATHDQAVLSALAGETGGIVSILNPGQDLDWRVFDLVASLHGERITDLRGELVGDDGAVYLSSRGVAAGEEISAVARAGAELPSAIRLRGIRGGEPWTLEVPIETAALSEDAGYLERHWARARIAALLADVEIENGVDRKAAIVELALKNWLLTPHTSLLVLETEADYKKYKVARSSSEGWAAYKVPAKVKIVYEPLTVGVDLAGADFGALIFRAPVALFRSQAQQLHRWGSFGGGRALVRGRWGTETGVGFGGVGLGIGGFGKSNSSRGSAWIPDAEQAQPVEKERLLGPRRDSRRSIGPAASTSVTQSFNEIVAGEVQRNGVVDFSGATDLENDRMAFNQHTDELANIAVGRSFESVLATAEQPIAAAGLLWPSDRRFDDLTSFLPAMFSPEFDRVRERLVRRSDHKLLAVEPAAAKRIERARQLAGSRRYQTKSGELIAISSRGHFRIRRRTETGLRESLTYDGNSLVSAYPELDIEVRREVGAAEPLLFEAETPMLLARAATLANFYSISAAGDSQIVLKPRTGKWRLVVTFDETGRLKKVERDVGMVTTELADLTYAGASVSVVRGGVAEKFATSAISDDEVMPLVGKSSVAIQLPLRHPEFAKAQLTDRASHHQLAATLAALGLFQEQGKIAAVLAKSAPLTRGEIVLLSGGLTLLPAKDLKVALAGANRDDSVFSYISGAQAYRFHRKGDALRASSKADGWVGALALLRRVTATTQISDSKLGASLIDELSIRRAFGALGFVAMSSFDQAHGWRQAKLVVRKWKTFARANPSWEARIRINVANALVRANDAEEAVKMWEVIRDSALDHGVLPPLNYQVASVFRASPRGEAGWQLFWGATRERILASGDARLMVGLAFAANQLGQRAHIARIVTAAADSGLTTGQRLQLVQLTNSTGHPEIARQLFRPLEAQIKDDAAVDPRILRLASSFAAAAGEKGKAAHFLRRAMSSEAGQKQLHQIRSEYTQLITWLSQTAQLASGATRAGAIDDVLLAAAEWRTLDPDNANLDTHVATALFSLGEPVQARRVLSSAIERHPMEGRSFQAVASVLERQAAVAEATQLWRRATTVEPENPTWGLRLARALVAQGRSDEAKTVLDKIIDRKDWHERFGPIVAQAKQTRTQL